MHEKQPENNSLIFSRETFFLMLIYFGLRLTSFILNKHTFTQAAFVFALAVYFIFLYFRKKEYALYFLAGELLLGGAGHFFEFFGLSLRTVLLLIFIILWLICELPKKWRHILNTNRNIIILFGIFGIFLVLSSALGVINQHGAKPVIQDLLPYGFFALILILSDLPANEQTKKYLTRLTAAFLGGSAIFSLFTFSLFSRGIEYLQSPYYKWFRDVAMGKITNMGEGFFRIVTPEHLLAVPLIILAASLLMTENKNRKTYLIFVILASLILVINFSRIYFISLFGGLLFLKYGHHWKKWAKTCCIIFATLAIFFGSINFIASNGKSVGVDLFLGRVKSLAQPETEVSTFTRMTLLSPIINMITIHPIAGSGIGAKIIFQNPVTQKTTATAQFDWGYLELWAELGILGFISFLSIIIYSIYCLIKKIRTSPDYPEFYVGLLGGYLSLMIINVTAPALFHTLGIVYIVFVFIASSPAQNTLFEKIKCLLGRAVSFVRK